MVVEYLWADGHYDRLPALAKDLVDQHVAAIAAVGGSVSRLAAKAATTSTPIVFSSGGDAVKLGLVPKQSRRSRSRPWTARSKRGPRPMRP